MPHKKKKSARAYAFLWKPLRRLVKKAIKKAEPSGREICGLILDNGSLLELVTLKNESKAPGSFELSWKKVKRAERAARRLGHRVVGTFHSHPVSRAVPGPSDLNCAWGKLMLIIACWDVETKLWRLRKGEAEELPFRLIDG
jgi:proteasome lid subunit RPN8/RPN11